MLFSFSYDMSFLSKNLLYDITEKFYCFEYDLISVFEWVGSGHLIKMHMCSSINLVIFYQNKNNINLMENIKHITTTET